MSSPAIVATTFYSSGLTPEITTAVIICVFIASAISVLLMKKNRLPPINEESMLETIRVLMRGRGAPEFLYSNMKKLGLVYRLRLPEMTPWIVVCDPTLVQSILTTEHEKPSLYKRFNGSNNGSTSIVSFHTSDTAWHQARKGMAPAFSMANICLSMPMMYAKTDEFKAILAEWELNGTTFDIGPMMTRMTMDFICAGMRKRLRFCVVINCSKSLSLDINSTPCTILTAMFAIDHRTMQSGSSEGSHLMKIMDIVMKEYGLKQIFSPFRFLMFWNAEVKQAKAAAVILEDSQRKLLADYRHKKSPEEISKDPSILGHLVRSPYKSEKERCADMTTLMIAGHETTAYTLSWIMIEIAKHPDVLAKLKKEIGSVVTTDENITVKQLSEMPYLDCVIKEGMRLWPAAALGTIRVMSKDIKYGAYNIPKGSLVQIPFYAVSRSVIQVSECNTT